jgi:2-methylisocitrate lyase-like PEP mutase family enzyme
MKTTKILREMLNSGEPFLTAGANDALSAVIAERAGFKAVTMGGYLATAVTLARPDIGLMTMSEMATQARHICAVTHIPLIADADNGHGNVLNVIRTIQELENAGAAGVVLEDQVMPKRCGHMAGKKVIPMEEHIQKIRAAVYARQDPDFIIIGRTDARQAHGIEDAIARGKAYAEAGADVIFVEAQENMEELERVPKEIHGVPLVVNMIEGGRTPLLSKDELGKMGYQVIFYNLGSLYTQTKAIQNYCEYVIANGTSAGFTGPMVTFDEFNSIVGLPELRELEEKFKN